MTKVTEVVEPKFVVTLFIILIAGTVILNGVIILVLLFSENLRTHPNMYIISLTIADLFVGTLISSSVLHIMLHGHVPVDWCLASGYTELGMFTTGVISLLALTFNRYTATFKHTEEVKPLKTTIFQIILIWVVSFAYATRYFIQIEVELSFAVVEISDNSTQAITRDVSDVCQFFLESRHFDIIFRIVDFVVLFLIPVSMMIIMYYKILKELNKYQTMFPSSTGQKKKVTRMLIASVTVFIVSWLPYYTQDIIMDGIEIITSSESEEEEDEESERLQVMVRFTTIVLALSSTITNPIIYGWLNRLFKREMKRKWQKIRNKISRHTRVVPVTTSTTLVVNSTMAKRGNIEKTRIANTAV